MKNNNKINSRIIAMTLIAFIIIYSLNMVFNPLEVQAAQSRVPYTNMDESRYPGYNSLISDLKTKYPNATFTMFYTGLNWSQVIANEALGHPKSPRNLISSSKSGAWICPTCGTKVYDNGSWYCASEYAIGYYMDPRNWLNSTYVFQFEETKFIEGTHNIDGIKRMTTGTFLAGDSIAKSILTASKNAGISPYYVVARIKQEQGSSGSSTAKGKYPGYEGYYNVFNINASGNGSTTIVSNALSYAKSKGWNTLEKSIIGGIDFLKSRYINRGQNTLYLNKFDVDSSDGTLYSHQYMQNVQAAYSESYTVYKVYENTGKRTSGAYNFIIPVYENMPGATTGAPSNSEITPINVKTTGTNINVRSSTSTGSSSIAKISSKGTVILSIERTGYANGYYWDKVVLQDGRIGYIASKYLELVDTVQTCNKLAILTGDNVNVRNGPGTNQTSVITAVAKGTMVTIIDEKCYNVDGMDWDRIILSDGRQAFVASKYLEEANTSSYETVQITGTGVRLRSAPGTSSSEILKFNTGTVLTRIEKGTSEINGYYWDKVTTSEGITGYIATNYLTVVNDGNTNPGNANEGENNNNNNEGSKGYKVDEGNKSVMVEPNTQVSDISNASGDKLATGSKIKINGTEYTVIKLGDVNCDGKVTSADYVRIKNHIMDVAALDKLQKAAADVNVDNKISSSDYVKIKNFIMEVSSIHIK